MLFFRVSPPLPPVPPLVVAHLDSHTSGSLIFHTPGLPPSPHCGVQVYPPRGFDRCRPEVTVHIFRATWTTSLKSQPWFRSRRVEHAPARHSSSFPAWPGASVLGDMTGAPWQHGSTAAHLPDLTLHANPGAAARGVSVVGRTTDSEGGRMELNESRPRQEAHPWLSG